MAKAKDVFSGVKGAEDVPQKSTGEPSHGSLGRGMEPELRTKQPLLSCSQKQHGLDWERRGMSSSWETAPPE